MSKPSLLKSRVGFRPFDYPWAYEFWNKQHQIHWLASEVMLHEDIKDWAVKLTNSEKNLLTHIFRFFTHADEEVLGCYHRIYSRIFKPIEIVMMLAAFSDTETTHCDAYSTIMETLGLPSVEYSLFMNYKEMKDKHDYMRTFNPESKHDIALTMAAFGAFTEGLQLFSSFAILLNFPRFNKMKGMGQIIAYSVRDESLHVEGILKLFHTFVDENPEVWTAALMNELQTICKTMVDHEDKFIDLAFELGDIEGLSAEEMKRYIRYIADRRLIQLNLEPYYKVKYNPIPWLDKMMNGEEFVNFFEQKNTNYGKATLTGSWEEAYAIHN